MEGASESRGSVIVVGSINIDLIVSVERLPTAGQTVTGTHLVRQSGGKGANQAVAAARAGARVAMVGAVGGDDFGEAALARLRDEGIGTDTCVVLPEVGTGVALIVVDAQGENQIATAPGANGELDGAMVTEALDAIDMVQDAVCLVSFEVGDQAVLAAVAWATARGLKVVLNPAPARPLHPGILDAAPILTPNVSELHALTGTSELEAGVRLLASRSHAPVIVTLGAEGALLLDHQVARLPAYDVKPVDTTGAGDALSGILSAELARRATLEDALRFAIVGAALSTTQSGAQAGMPSRELILQHSRASAGTEGTEALKRA